MVGIVFGILSGAITVLTFLKLLKELRKKPDRSADALEAIHSALERIAVAIEEKS